MLQTLRLSVSPIREALVPPIIQPLIDSACGCDLTKAILAITNELGFDDFTHGTSLSMHPNAESHSYVYTTLPPRWVERYDQNAFLEVDPRIQFGMESPLPLIWDQHSSRGKSTAQDAFLDAALEFGIASGISISQRDSRSRLAVTALNSSIRVLDWAQRSRISQRIGDIMALSQYFHEIFISQILARKLAPTATGKPLSRRERQCLALSANGMTSIDIGVKLGITERTANFHFTNIISKLGVLNRNEAVAKAVARGLINIEC